MRAFGLDLLAVGKNVNARASAAHGNGGGVGNRQLHKEGERTVTGRQLDMHAKPDKGVLVIAVVSWRMPVAWWSGAGRSACWVVFVGNILNGLRGVAQGPGGVVEVRHGRGRIGGYPHAPVLIQRDRRSKACRVEVYRRCVLRVGGSGRGMAMWSKNGAQWPLWAGRMRLPQGQRGSAQRQHG